MKRWMFIGSGVVAILIIAFLVIWAWANHTTTHTNMAASASRQHNSQSNNKSSANKNKQKPTSVPQQTTSACEKLLSTVQATALLGGAPSLGSTNGTPDYQNPHLTITTCTYTRSGQIIRVVAYNANDSVGISDNKVVFGSGKPTNAVAVQGYGDIAYWVQNSGVLNILFHNNWYEISNGAGESTSVTQAEQVARVVLSNL